MNPQTKPSSKAVLLSALAVFAVLILFVIFRPPPPSAPPPEIDLTRLTNRNGRLYVIGETNTFTGVMTESFPDGSVKSRSEIVDGRMHGKSEGYFPNGQRQIEEFFKEGVSDGVRTRWGTNGVKESDGTIVRGEFHGEYRKWHPNGQLAEHIFFEKDKPHGVAKAWYPSGYLKSRVEMEHGETKKQETWEDMEMRDEPRGN